MPDVAAFYQVYVYVNPFGLKLKYTDMTPIAVCPFELRSGSYKPLLPAAPHPLQLFASKQLKRRNFL